MPDLKTGCSISLTESNFLLLERLNGRTLLRVIAEELGMEREEALSFLEVAVAEGMVVKGEFRVSSSELPVPSPQFPVPDSGPRLYRCGRR